VDTWFSTDHDKELKVLLKRVEQPQLEIDPQSYAATMNALNRFNTFTYHFRPTYVFGRLSRLAIHWSEHVFSRWRLDRIIARCQQPARRQSYSEASGRAARKAA
jgi:hypothetical protein